MGLQKPKRMARRSSLGALPNSVVVSMDGLMNSGESFLDVKPNIPRRLG